FTALYRGQVMVAGGSFSAGGDSGSLIVTTDNARPIGLLYGGNSVGTVANPLLDTVDSKGSKAPGVITAFTNASGALSIVGGPDHPVSCAHTASASAAQVGTAQAALTPAERQRVSAVQQRRAAALLRDFALSSVEAGSSADNPAEGALLLHVSGRSAPAVPAVIEGVRTRLVFDNADAAAAQTPSPAMINRALVVKDAHSSDFMGHPGIQGIGVSISADNPTESAVSIFTVQGVAHPPIPAVIDGVRTRIFEGTRFKAY